MANDQVSPRLDGPWAEGRTETWLDGLKRAVRSAPHSDIRRMLPLTPENVLALIEAACSQTVAPPTTDGDDDINPLYGDYKQIPAPPAVSTPPHHRWNLEHTSDGIRICEGHHHRSADCEWIEYVLKPEAGAVSTPRCPELAEFLSLQIWDNWHGPLCNVPPNHDACVKDLEGWLAQFFQPDSQPAPPQIPQEMPWPDGVPCTHPGCLRHLSHPCEGCGRIGGRYPAQPSPEGERK